MKLFKETSCSLQLSGLVRVLSVVSPEDMFSHNVAHVVSVKYSKFSNIFLFLSPNKMCVTRAGIHKMLVRIANREDPEAVLSGSRLFV